MRFSIALLVSLGGLLLAQGSVFGVAPVTQTTPPKERRIGVSLLFQKSEYDKEPI